MSLADEVAAVIAPHIEYLATNETSETLAATLIALVAETIAKDIDQYVLDLTMTRDGLTVSPVFWSRLGGLREAASVARQVVPQAQTEEQQ